MVKTPTKNTKRIVPQDSKSVVKYNKELLQRQKLIKIFAQLATDFSAQTLNNEVAARFRKTVLKFHRSFGRHHLAWRLHTDPYKILVSEIMLQQTQVNRVGPYYDRFVEKFPDITSLAKAKTEAVLRLWQGLGYNRRGLALLETARILKKEFNSELPLDYEGLLNLPGIGSYTAKAVLAFAHDKSEALLETNIRSVYHYFFFQQRSKPVSDAEVLEAIEQSRPKGNGRIWNYALMDLGSFLKEHRLVSNATHAGYRKQSPFEGSVRQIRGQIIKFLLSGKEYTELQLIKNIPCSIDLFKPALDGLLKEKVLRRNRLKIGITA